jgi:hypothetical protein
MLVFTPKFVLDSSVYVHTYSLPSLATIVGIATYDNHHLYTVTFKDGSISEYMDDIFSAVPETNSSPLKT